MHLKVKLISAAIMALGLQASAFAQSAAPVVPPPKPIGQAGASLYPGPSANPVAQPAAQPLTQPVVLPPVSTRSVNAAATASPIAAPAAAQPAALLPATELIDIALPAAPKPDSGRALTPSAPTAVSKPAAAQKKATVTASAPKAREVVVEKKVDPYSGLVGTPVSDSQLNRFVYPEAVEGVYFPEGSPLPECPADAGEHDPCKPVFLNGKRVMLLQLRAGAKGPVQMMTHLHSGRFVTLNLMPSAGPGAVIRVDGAEDGASDARLARAQTEINANGSASGMTASEQNVEMLSRIARGDIPAGFEPISVSGKPVRFELFDVIQMASWDNESGLRAHLFQVVAHDATPVAIGPSLFRHETVKALALDRDTITNTSPALLYMLEAVELEAN